MNLNEFTESMTCSECGGPAFSDLILAEKKDACYNKVRSRYKVWPSAYASGALVQCRKKGAANWGNKSKNESVAEGLNEMDKSAPQPGRDGKVSHSTYGSRDKKGSDYFKGKEAPGKPVTAKQMSKDALDILKKQGVAEDQVNEISANPDYLRAAERSRSQARDTQRQYWRSPEEKAAARRTELKRDKGIGGYTKRHRAANPDAYPTPKAQPAPKLRDPSTEYSDDYSVYAAGRRDTMEQGVAEDKGMSGYTAFKREWRAKHGSDAKVPAYDSKEYTSYVYRHNDKKQGVGEAVKQKLTIGSKVTHPIHGEGTVVMHSTGGGNMGTVVKFANGKKAKVDHKKLTMADQGVAEGAPIVVAQAPIDVRNPKKAPQPYRNQGDIVPDTKPASTEKRGVKGRPGQRPMPDRGVAEGNYDRDDYYNARRGSEYGRGLAATGYGGDGSATRRDDIFKGQSKRLPADPFARTTGAVPKGSTGRIHSTAYPDEMEEGLGSKLAGLGLAGAMTLGSAGANARVTPDGQGGYTGGFKPAATATAPAAAPTATAPASQGFSKEYLQRAADPNRTGRYMISIEKAQELLSTMQEGDISQLEKAVADAPVKPVANMESATDSDGYAVDQEDAGEYDYEGDQAKDQLQTIVAAARKLDGILDDNENMPEWVQMKITKATDYLDTAADYVAANKAQAEPMAETNQEKIGGRHDPADFDSMVGRLKKLAGAGPMKTVYDPNTRRYKNIPTAVQPGSKK